jgi:hypothetical protein
MATALKTVEQSLDELKPQLAKLREKFPPNAISKLPKPTKKQTEDVKADFKKGIRCTICGSWHHPDVVHLDYVGHAALTDRLLDTDLEWSWEPVGFTLKACPRSTATEGSGSSSPSAVSPATATALLTGSRAAMR